MKKKNIIKQLGMEEEFKNWLIDIKERNTTLKKGDRIELVKPIAVFSNLRIGMKGTVKEVLKSSSSIEITFDEINRPYTLDYIRERYRKIK